MCPGFFRFLWVFKCLPVNSVSDEPPGCLVIVIRWPLSNGNSGNVQKVTAGFPLSGHTGKQHIFSTYVFSSRNFVCLSRQHSVWVCATGTPCKEHLLGKVGGLLPRCSLAAPVCPTTAGSFHFNTSDVWTQPREMYISVSENMQQAEDMLMIKIILYEFHLFCEGTLGLFTYFTNTLGSPRFDQTFPLAEREKSVRSRDASMDVFSHCDENSRSKNFVLACRDRGTP